MFALEAVDARKGDALIIRWGTADQPRTMLVDGGPSPTWATRLKPRLEQFAGFDPLDGQLPIDLDLVVVSHVDDDHIQGILDLTNEIFQANSTGTSPSVTMKELWHNAFTDHDALPELQDEPVLGDPAVPQLVEELTIPFTNRSLRAQVTSLLGVRYTMNQMSYDLARLRRNALIERLPHTNTYVLTADGQRVAIFYTKVHDRLLRPLLAANTPPAPPDLRQALKTIDHHVRDYVDTARLTAA